jgi:hypothetical protein
MRLERGTHFRVLYSLSNTSLEVMFTQELLSAISVDSSSADDSNTSENEAENYKSSRRGCAGVVEGGRRIGREQKARAGLQPTLQGFALLRGGVVLKLPNILHKEPPWDFQFHIHRMNGDAELARVDHVALAE